MLACIELLREHHVGRCRQEIGDSESKKAQVVMGRKSLCNAPLTSLFLLTRSFLMSCPLLNTGRPCMSQTTVDFTIVSFC